MTQNIFAKPDSKSGYTYDIVLNYIQKNPGSHMRGIYKNLDMPLGTLRYHLSILEKKDLIISEKYNSYRNYFISGLYKEYERDLLKVINKKTLKKIISYLLNQDNPVKLDDIADNTAISRASAAWHVKELVNLGVAVESNGGRYKKYKLVESTEITNFLKIYVNRYI